jgi:hypothetical protein
MRQQPRQQQGGEPAAFAVGSRCKEQRQARWYLTATCQPRLPMVYCGGTAALDGHRHGVAAAGSKPDASPLLSLHRIMSAIGTAAGAQTYCSRRVAEIVRRWRK